MKICQKNNCNNEATLRSKFCEIHRSIKRTREIENQIKLEKDIEKQSLLEQERKIEKEYLEQERKLKSEQDIEYQHTIEQDRKRMEDSEYENILKLSIEQFYIDKKNNVEIEPTDGDFYSIKIKTPFGKILIRNFNIDSKIKSIRNFLDVYFNENKIDIHNYDIVFNFPYSRLSIIDDEKYIKDFSEQRKIMLHIYNHDS